MKRFSVGSSYLREGGLRLDGRNYSERSFWARLVARDCGYKVATIGDLAPSTFTPPRFKRLYVDYDNGHPYLSASELLVARPPRVRFASPQIPGFKRYLVEEGWTLITDSGTVGRTIFVNRTLAKFFVSNNAVRVVPEDETIAGYLYAYLACPLGQALLAKDQYGAVIKHVESFHVTQIPVPLPPMALRRHIHDGIFEAYRLRDHANELLDEADSMVYRGLGLPRVAETAHFYRSLDVKAFGLTSSDLDLRLDGSHYDPPGRQVVRTLEQREDVRYLADVTERIFHPFRMNMVLVDKDHGVPFLGGGDIVEYRYFADKYISPITENYKTYLLERGWTLVTIGGTTGRVAYVGPQIEGWAASQHVARIVPRQSEIHPGYLHAFMASDYGRLQINNLVYGAVVDTIRESQLDTLRIPVPSKAVQRPIHEMVEAAHKHWAKANELEDRTIKLLENTLLEAYDKRGGQEKPNARH